MVGTGDQLLLQFCSGLQAHPYYLDLVVLKHGSSPSHETYRPLQTKRAILGTSVKLSQFCVLEHQGRIETHQLRRQLNNRVYPVQKRPGGFTRKTGHQLNSRLHPFGAEQTHGTGDVRRGVPSGRLAKDLVVHRLSPYFDGSDTTGNEKIDNLLGDTVWPGRQPD